MSGASRRRVNKPRRNRSINGLFTPFFRATATVTMRPAIVVAVLVALLSGCAASHGRVRELNPDCTQVSAEEQAKGNCMHRSELPDGRA